MRANSGAWPAARSASQSGAVRRSCQTMAGATGAPVARSHSTVVSRWLVMPMAATSRAPTPALASTSCMTPDCVAQISAGVVLDPAGLRKDLPEFALRDRAHGARVIEEEGARAGRALIERKDE